MINLFWTSLLTLMKFDMKAMTFIIIIIIIRYHINSGYLKLYT
jgi:hypothetical protein